MNTSAPITDPKNMELPSVSTTTFECKLRKNRVNYVTFKTSHPDQWRDATLRYFSPGNLAREYFTELTPDHGSVRGERLRVFEDKSHQTMFLSFIFYSSGSTTVSCLRGLPDFIDTHCREIFDLINHDKNSQTAILDMCKWSFPCSSQSPVQVRISPQRSVYSDNEEEGVDELRREVMELKKTVTEIQQERLKDQKTITSLMAAVNSLTAKLEGTIEGSTVRSFASVVGSASESNTVALNRAVLVKEVSREQSYQRQKANNIILSGLPEDRDDVKAVRDLAEDVGVNLKDISISVKRVGQTSDSGKPKKLIVTLDKEKKYELLRKSRQMRSMSRWSSVYIGPDLTRAEQEAAYALRCELRRRRDEQPATRWQIRHGRVTAVSTPGSGSDERDK